MGLGDVSDRIIPKFAIIAPPRHQGNITSRYFVPYSTHPSYPLTGAICLSYCCLVKGCVAEGVGVISSSQPETIIIEHPSGQLQVQLETSFDRSQITISSATVIRTARLLYSGRVYVPKN